MEFFSWQTVITVYTVYIQIEREERQPLDIIIRNTTNQPIYEQVYLQIKNSILSGELSSGEALPSIRGLAKDLRISVITTKRAYDELEAEGFITTVAGKGCFVAEQNLALLQEQRLREIEAHLSAAVDVFHFLSYQLFLGSNWR